MSPVRPLKSNIALYIKTVIIHNLVNLIIPGFSRIGLEV